MSYLLDTNIVTAILKQNQKVKSKLREVGFDEQDVSISCMTYYEIKGGLLAVNATRKLSNFYELCDSDLKLLLLDMDVLDTASAIYANLKQRGMLIQTADIFIAATAMARNLTLISNDSDMYRISGVMVEDWL